jgi:hypothetical protein
MSFPTAVSSRSRALLLGVGLVPLAIVLSLLSPGRASASVGFCEFAKLAPGASCEYGAFVRVTGVFAEVTSGNGEICVAINEPGGVRVGKRCGFNRAQSQEGIGTNQGKAWVHNNSSSTLTVFGLFTQ